MRFVIAHENGVTFAARAPEGDFMSPRHVTEDFAVAHRFDTDGEASDASQNFGPEWQVEEIG